MKVTSDRIKARAEELRMTGFKLRGRMVQATLELNAGVRPRTTPNKATQSSEVPEEQPAKPATAKAA